jgi:hypothetical protein
LPIIWNDDRKTTNDTINSVVTFFESLHFLNETEEDDNFDKMLHRNRPRRDYDKSESDKDDSELLPNIATFIGGKYIKANGGKEGKGNFIINGIDSYEKWHTIYRRCKGIGDHFRDFFDDLVEEHEKIYKKKIKIQFLPEEAPKKYLIENKRKLTSCQKKGKENQLDPEIIDLIVDCIQKNPLFSHRQNKK